MFSSCKELSVIFASNHSISAQMICHPFFNPRSPSLEQRKPSGQTPRLPLELALQPPGQLPGEEHVRQFAVTVGEATVVALLTMEVMEADSASVMSQRGHVHDAGWRTLLQTLQQEESQEKMT